MRVNNNNQTSFGIGIIQPMIGIGKLDRRIGRIERKILEVGHPLSDCCIFKACGKTEVHVRIFTPNKTLIFGSVTGNPWTDKGLLKLVKKANAKMNQLFVNAVSATSSTK